MNNSKRRRETAQSVPYDQFGAKGPSGRPSPLGSRRARRHPAPAVAPNLFARRNLRKAIEAVVMQSQARG